MTHLAKTDTCHHPIQDALNKLLFPGSGPRSDIMPWGTALFPREPFMFVFGCVTSTVARDAGGHLMVQFQGQRAGLLPTAPLPRRVLCPPQGHPCKHALASRTPCWDANGLRFPGAFLCRCTGVCAGEGTRWKAPAGPAEDSHSAAELLHRKEMPWETGPDTDSSA